MVQNLIDWRNHHDTSISLSAGEPFCSGFPAWMASHVWIWLAFWAKYPIQDENELNITEELVSPSRGQFPTGG
jgi:hypothetical protein